MSINWEKEINKLSGPFPEVGKEPPALESDTPKGKVGLDDVGDFSKLVTMIYFFTDKSTGRTYTMEKHWLIDYDEVTLRDALTIIKKTT